MQILSLQNGRRRTCGIYPRNSATWTNVRWVDDERVQCLAGWLNRREGWGKVGEMVRPLSDHDYCNLE